MLPQATTTAHRWAPREHLAFVLLAFGLIVLAAARPDACLLGMAAVIPVILFHRWPVAFVVLFALLEPLQGAFGQVLPDALRLFDELGVLTIGTLVLGRALIRNPGALRRDSFVQLLVVFLCLGGLSMWKNEVPLKTGLAGLFVTVDYLILFLSLRVHGVSLSAATWLQRTLLGLGIVATSLAMVQHLFPSTILSWQVSMIESGVARVPGPFVHPNGLGYFMLIATFVAVGRALVNRRPGAWILVAICALGVFLSVSRSSYAGLFVGFVAGVLLVQRKLWKVALILGLVAVTILGPFVVSGINARIQKFHLEGGDARITYLLNSVPILLDHPLLGVGPGRFGGEVAHRYGSDVYKTYDIRFDGTWSTVDDFWLHLLVESGLLGFFSFLGIFLLILRRSLQRLQGAPLDDASHSLLLALPMVTVAYLLINLASMANEANESAGIFWLLAGVSLASAGPPEAPLPHSNSPSASSTALA